MDPIYFPGNFPHFMLISTGATGIFVTLNTIQMKKYITNQD